LRRLHFQAQMLAYKTTRGYCKNTIERRSTEGKTRNAERGRRHSFVGLRRMQAQKQVNSNGLLEIIKAIYYISEAMKVAESYDPKAFELLTEAKDSLVDYLISQVRKDE